jgi:tRNA-dihydrouridine synthase A
MPITPINRAFSVAPMLDWTDRHCRYFHRLLTRHAVLYTEMLAAGALLHGDRERFLHYSPEERPLALQLGGSDPKDLAVCARIAEDYGYDEVNLNVGCPSDRVQNGRFGACLMAEPQLVADCITAMRNSVAIPVTVKTRIGIDDRDAYEDLLAFIDTVASAGCTTFIVHARKAWLSGLSPKQNREIPPLRYDAVQRLKQERPRLQVIVNGGISDLPEAQRQFAELDGIMIGREAYHNPYCLASVDRLFYADAREPLSRSEAVEALLPYIRAQLQQGVRLHNITRHILGLFHGIAGARGWRRHLSEYACRDGGDVQTVRDALALLRA